MAISSVYQSPSAQAQNIRNLNDVTNLGNLTLNKGRFLSDISENVIHNDALQNDKTREIANLPEVSQIDRQQKNLLSLATSQIDGTNTGTPFIQTPNQVARQIAEHPAQTTLQEAAQEAQTASYISKPNMNKIVAHNKGTSV